MKKIKATIFTMTNEIATNDEAVLFKSSRPDNLMDDDEEPIAFFKGFACYVSRFKHNGIDSHDIYENYFQERLLDFSEMERLEFEKYNSYPYELLKLEVENLNKFKEYGIFDFKREVNKHFFKETCIGFLDFLITEKGAPYDIVNTVEWIKKELEDYRKLFNKIRIPVLYPVAKTYDKNITDKNQGLLVEEIYKSNILVNSKIIREFKGFPLFLLYNDSLLPEVFNKNKIEVSDTYTDLFERYLEYILGGINLRGYKSKKIIPNADKILNEETLCIKDILEYNILESHLDIYFDKNKLNLNKLIQLHRDNDFKKYAESEDIAFKSAFWDICFGFIDFLLDKGADYNKSKHREWIKENVLKDNTMQCFDNKNKFTPDHKFNGKKIGYKNFALYHALLIATGKEKPFEKNKDDKYNKALC